MTICPLHEASVNVISGLKHLGGDAWLHPIHVKNDNRLWSPLDGGWVAAGPIRHDQPQVLFANMSSHPLRLCHGQVVALMTLYGTHECCGISAVSHFLSALQAPTVFSCVPKRPSPSPPPATDRYLDAVPGLPTKRDPPEQLDLCWNKRSGAAHRCPILRTPPRAHEAPTGEDGAGTLVPSTTSPRRNKGGAHEAPIGTRGIEI